MNDKARDLGIWFVPALSSFYFYKNEMIFDEAVFKYLNNVYSDDW